MTEEQVEQPIPEEKEITTETEVEVAKPAEEKRYLTYALKVDPDEDDRAVEIKMCSAARPHMRAFHFAWLGFFSAFCIWFAIAPLLPEIKKTLGLTKQEVWASNIISVSGTIALRFILGPICDKYGARIPLGVLLICGAIPTACLGLVNTRNGFYVLRFFIGLSGGAFVMCSSWTSAMFCKKVVGTANGIAAGWGNLGGGVTILFMGAVLFPLFELGMSAEMAWRTVCLVPAFLAACVGVMIIKFSDDCPKGDYAEMKKLGNFKAPGAKASIWRGAKNYNTWLMFIQYGCCFGVELTMDNAATLYYHDRFGLSTEMAALVASIFGFMNIFSRGLGGYLSDVVKRKFGMKGRLWLQFWFLMIEGGLIIGFIHAKNLGVSIFVFTIFSLFAEMLCGTSFGIAPYINPKATGSVTGIIGAGGNVGAVCFGLVFRAMDAYWAFIIMGCVVFFAAFTVLFMYIPGFGGVFCEGTKATAERMDKLGVSTATNINLEDSLKPTIAFN